MTNYAVQDVDITELVDIRGIKIDDSLQTAEKKKLYYQQIKDPYHFRFGDMTVRVSFMDSGPTLQDRIKQYLLSGQGMELASTY
jgi:hypothetical protein